MKGRPAPASGLLRQLDSLARAALPSGVTALLMMLAVVPLGLFGLVPAIALPCVFFWSVFRPAALPPPAVFGLGLLQDLLTAAPLGSGVLVLLVVHGLAARWRRLLAKQSFLLVWLAFCGVAAGAAALATALQALLGWQALPLPPGLWQAVLTAGLYPLLAWPLTRAHEAMIRAEAAP
ncbi:rod shape-determining protein MreD [Paracraurococcus ruber]|uniref:Rod shape-determining protein MreD n=1 Tax=Paracraurococcus ruber TaxID=77675 RepID=A0ABS1CUS7_9PROT|nr:rod shape-determining protein MreD [Paracraurococcus ruber]MBK1657981.1 rod shape-determining protein MreD [Paracraurococcus ruber]TDG30374.1 rod shape-determining protein MreD [Paracraurococcus ruber]